MHSSIKKGRILGPRRWSTFAESSYVALLVCVSIILLRNHIVFFVINNACLCITVTESIEAVKMSEHTSWGVMATCGRSDVRVLFIHVHF